MRLRILQRLRWEDARGNKRATGRPVVSKTNAIFLLGSPACHWKYRHRLGDNHIVTHWPATKRTAPFQQGHFRTIRFRMHSNQCLCPNGDEKIPALHCILRFRWRALFLQIRSSPGPFHFRFQIPRWYVQLRVALKMMSSMPSFRAAFHMASNADRASLRRKMRVFGVKRAEIT